METPDIFAELDEFEQTKPVGEEQLGIISDLAKKQSFFEFPADPKNVKALYKFIKENNLSILDVEEALKWFRRDYQKIRTDELPTAMEAIGMENFTMKGGGKVELKSDVSVTVKDHAKLNSFFTKKGWSDLIKNQIQVLFPKKGKENADKLVKHLEETYTGDCDVVRKENVHPMTLKSHVKREREKGTKFPEDILTVFEYKFTKIK